MLFAALRRDPAGNSRKKVLTKMSSYAIIYKHLGVRPKYRGVEQLVARRAHNPEVVGSSPASATIKTPGIHYEYRDFSNFLA